MKQTHKTQPIRLTITTNPTNLINFPWTIINIFSNQDFLSNQMLYNSHLINWCLKFSAQHFLGNFLSTQTHKFSYEININTNPTNNHPHENPEKTLHQSNNQTHHHTTYQTIKRVRESQRLREKQPTTIEGVIGAEISLDLSEEDVLYHHHWWYLLVCPTLFSPTPTLFLNANQEKKMWL